MLEREYRNNPHPPGCSCAICVDERLHKLGLLDKTAYSRQKNGCGAKGKREQISNAQYHSPTCVCEPCVERRQAPKRERLAKAKIDAQQIKQGEHILDFVDIELAFGKGKSMGEIKGKHIDVDRRQPITKSTKAKKGKVNWLSRLLKGEKPSKQKDLDDGKRR